MKSCLVVGEDEFSIATRRTRAYDEGTQIRVTDFGIVIIDATARGALDALRAIEEMPGEKPVTLVHHFEAQCPVFDRGKLQTWKIRTSLLACFPFATFILTNEANPWEAIERYLHDATQLRCA